MSQDFQTKYLLGPERLQRSFKSGKTSSRRIELAQNEDGEIFKR